MRRIGIVLVGLLFLTTLFTVMTPHNVEAARPAPTGDVVDVPVWHPGDKWEYYASGNLVMSGYTFSGEGYVNFTVSPTNSIMDVNIGNETYKCYNVVIYGVVDFTGSATGSAKFNGNIWYRQSDLAYTRITINVDMNANVSTPVGAVPMAGTMDSDTTFMPPTEECDFPLTQGEEWEILSHTHSENAGTGVLSGVVNPTMDSDLDYNYTCSEVLPSYSVQGNNYKVYHNVPSDSGMNDIYYSPDINYYVKMVFVFGGFPLNLEVQKYTPSPVENKVSVSLNPESATFGEEVTVDVTLQTAISGGTATLTVPQVGISESTTFSGMSFSMTLTAPIAADDTPTTYDVGSFGVVVTVNNIHYGVKTLTVDGPDLSISPSDIHLTPADDIVQGDNVTVQFDIKNKGTALASPSVAQITMGSTVITRDVPQIEADSSTTITANFIPLVTGNTDITIKLNFDGAVSELQKNNNMASVTVIVAANSKPTVESISPPIDVLYIDEGAKQVFKVNASDPNGDTLIYNWSIHTASGKVLSYTVGSSSTFTFTANFTGDHSSINSPYTIKCDVTDTRPASVRLNTSTSWSLFVKNINRAPTLTSNNTIVNIQEGESYTFHITAQDPDMDELTYSWKVNGVSVSGNGANFTFESAYVGEYSAGEYKVNVSVSDGEDTRYYQWSLNVENVNRAPNITSVSPEDGSVVKEGEDTIFSAQANDPDGDDLTYTWTSDIQGELGSGTSISAKLKAGTHKVTLTVSDGNATDTRTITMIVTKAKESGGSSSSGNSGYADMAIIVLTVMGIAALVYKRRRY